MTLVGGYVPGRSVLHRLPAGAKLLALLVVSVAAVVVRSLAATLGLLLLDVVLVFVGRLRPRSVLPRQVSLWVMFALLATYQVWQRGVLAAVVVVGGLLGLVVLAAVFTAVTPADELVAVVTRALRPLRRVGVDPELVGLSFALLIRGIPTTLDLAAQTRQAALARGLERSPRAYLVPWVIRVVAHARATGDSLAARGVGD